jgi:hypothetical protein
VIYTEYNVAIRSLPRTGAEEHAAGSDLLAARKDEAVIDFVRRAAAEAAAGAMIELGSGVVALALGENAEMNSVGQILAEKARCSHFSHIPADRLLSPGVTRAVGDKHVFPLLGAQL